MALAGAQAALGNVFDDAKFKLDLRGGESSYTKPGNLGNALDYSSASPIVGWMGDQRGPWEYSSKVGILTAQETTQVRNPYYPLVVKDQTVLHFYQYNPNATDATKGVRTGVVFPGLAPQGDVQTFYLRFRWDGAVAATTPNPPYLLQSGNSDNGNSAYGVAIYLDSPTVINNGATTNVIVKLRVGAADGQKDWITSNLTISSGAWNDLFVTFSKNDGEDKYTTTVSLCKTPKALGSGFEKPEVSKMSIVYPSHPQFDSSNLTLGTYHASSSSDATTRSFRGLVADFMIWDRALTDDEKLDVITGVAPSGGEWQIGAANGSAVEFDDADPAAVYDVQSMPWHRMRKTLDSANPSLSISTTMSAVDHQMARTLTITPILSGAASTPVEVALNGTVVGEIDLATTTSITIPRKLWRHDGEANIITITRTAPISGTVQFDAVSLAPAATQPAGTVLEDATFKLDLRGGESTYTKPGDIGNAYDHSSASALVGWMGDQRGPWTYDSNYGNLPAQETADVQNPYLPYTTNSQTVLHFYQDKKSETTSVRSSIVIPGAAPQGKVQTFYVRLRWDGMTQAEASAYHPAYIFQSGNAANGWSAYGLGFFIAQEVSKDLITTNFCFGIRGADNQLNFSNLKLNAGEWADVFLTVEQNAGNTSYKATATLCKPSPSGTAAFNTPSLTSNTRSDTKTLVFNSRNLTIGGYHESSSGATPTRGFRGLIADFMVWERALTNDEKCEVMAGRHGAKWMVGAVNGSADEFTDDNPAAVFEPESMPWRQMRKTLTAANPTLTLKSPLAAFEAGNAIIFTLRPVPDGLSHPVRVAVNGTAIGDFDAASDGSIVIPRASLTRDGSGDVTVTATSLDTSKPLAIDLIALSGSWQNAPDDGNSNGMLNEKNAPSRAFAGDIDVKHFTSSISVGASHTNYTFGVWVPEGMGEKAGWKFRTKTTGSVSSPVEDLPDARHTVYVNGAAVGSHDGWFAANESFVLDIPAGTLHDGMNYVQWVQTAPTLAAQQAVSGKPGIFQYYDFWGMTLVPPQSPFMLIVR